LNELFIFEQAVLFSATDAKATGMISLLIGIDGGASVARRRLHGRDGHPTSVFAQAQNSTTWTSAARTMRLRVRAGAFGKSENTPKKERDRCSSF
jgi:hypothetical protein